MILWRGMAMAMVVSHDLSAVGHGEECTRFFYSLDALLLMLRSWVCEGKSCDVCAAFSRGRLYDSSMQWDMVLIFCLALSFRPQSCTLLSIIALRGDADARGRARRVFYAT